MPLLSLRVNSIRGMGGVQRISEIKLYEDLTSLILAFWSLIVYIDSFPRYSGSSSAWPERPLGKIVS